MTIPDDDTWYCRNCRFWDVPDGEKVEDCLDDPQACIRYPPPGPREVVMEDGACWETWPWPETYEDDRCGEWQPRAQVKPAFDLDKTLSYPELGGAVFGPLKWGAGLKTYRDLVNRTAAELLCYRNIGPVRLAILRAHLAELGLALRGDPEPPPAEAP